MAITLNTERDRQLYTEIHQAVHRACRNLLHQATFDDRDGAITDAAYERIQPRIAAGEIKWHEREVHIARYVAKSASLERLGMARRAARRHEATDEYDPCALTVDPRVDVHESVILRDELRERIQAARQEQINRVRGAAILRQQIVALAERQPASLRTRFAAVMFCLHKGERTYAEVATELASLGFGMPDLALMRQWTKRYGTDVQAWFDQEVATL